MKSLHHFKAEAVQFGFLDLRHDRREDRGPQPRHQEFKCDA